MGALQIMDFIQEPRVLADIASVATVLYLASNNKLGNIQLQILAFMARQ